MISVQVAPWEEDIMDVSDLIKFTFSNQKNIVKHWQFVLNNIAQTQAAKYEVNPLKTSWSRLVSLSWEYQNNLED